MHVRWVGKCVHVHSCPNFGTYIYICHIYINDRKDKAPSFIHTTISIYVRSEAYFVNEESHDKKKSEQEREAKKKQTKEMK